MRSPRRCGGARRDRSHGAHGQPSGSAAGCSTSWRPTALLERLGIPRAPSVALDAGITQAPALPFAYPVAVKALSARSRTRPTSAAWCSGSRDDAALLAAIAKIRAGHRSVDRVLVQPMMSGLGEVLIGYRVDPDVGPLVMLAAGGILTEIYRDRSLRLAPVDLADAKAMIAEVAALKALAGYRGRPKGDLDALAQGARGAVAAGGHDGPPSPRPRSIR